MAGSSFMQTSFLGGHWSKRIQGRMEDPSYKEGMNRCYNSYPVETGAWQRRSGSRQLMHTKSGNPARLFPFDYRIDQPYQIELTAGFLRLFAGLALVMAISANDTVSEALVQDISADAQAVMTLDLVPDGWANGNTIVIDVRSQPCSSTQLCYRQFILSDKSGNTFKLKDALTLAYVDGATIDYTPPDPLVTNLDVAQKVFELATPYTEADLAGIRIIVGIDNVLLLHESYAPRKLQFTNSGGPFTLTTEVFLDGPYLDKPTTGTTIALSALTGSVTVTANSAAGINNDQGFQTTDVGRLIRYRSSPKDWAIGTTYPKQFYVTGSDGNIYISVAGANLGNNPITNDGTKWEITDERFTWTWLRITARTSTTVVTATILGPSPPAGNAVSHFRMGVYSDTDGWPRTAAYHEGRLWFAGPVANRVDGSKSNELFNFEPTGPDGTVADDNAVALVANADEANKIFWMMSTDDGLMVGTQASEWRIRASSTDDPISPTTAQFRKVSAIGSADIAPVDASQTLFVQRQQRKLLAHVRASDNEYFGENISITADDLTVTGIAEIVWQRQPNMVVWGRREDNVLVGCVFKKAQSSYALKSLNAIWGQAAVGWHEHLLGSGRVVKSISSGPSYDGLSDTLFMVTEDEFTGYHFVEVLMPVFDEQMQGYEGHFVDAGGTPCCVQFMETPADAFDGLRFFGLHYIVGSTVVPFLGGLDLGDRVVQTGGYVDVPFSSDPAGLFTELFIGSFDVNADFGIFTAIIPRREPPGPQLPPIQNYQQTTHIGVDVDGVDGSYNGHCLVDQYDGADRVFQIQHASGAITAGIRMLDDFGELVHNSEANIYAPDSWSLAPSPYVFIPRYNGVLIEFHNEGWIFGNVDQNGASNNCMPVNTISGQTLGFVDSYGQHSSVLVPDPVLQRFPAMGRSVAHLRIQREGGSTWAEWADYAVYSAVSGGAARKNIIMMEINPITGQTLYPLLIGSLPDYAAAYWTVDEASSDVCRGLSGKQVVTGSIFAIGHPTYGVPATTPWGVYRINARRWGPGEMFTIPWKEKIGTVSPAQVDPTWTNFADFTGVMYDHIDGNLLFFARTTDAVTHKYRLVKINAGTAVVMWTLPFDVPATAGFDGFDEQCAAVAPINGSISFIDTSALNPDTIYHVNTVLGTVVSTFVVNPGTVCSGRQYWQPTTGSLTLFGSYTDAGSPDPVPYGQWAGNNFTSKWYRIFAGGPSYIPIPSPGSEIEVDYKFPMSIGFNYLSEGQLLRPDFGQDAGTQNGPAFGKLRRLHWYGANFYRTQKVSIGTDFTTMYPVKFETPGKIPYPANSLFTGVVSDTVQSNYDFDGQIAWRTTRPYNCTVTAMAGYLQASDK